MKTVYVTGATGILGANVCSELMRKGYKARATVRDMDAADSRSLAEAGVEVLPGDLKDRDSLARAIDGADGVIHSGAMLGRPGATWEEGYATNVIGTMNVFSEAAAAGNIPVVHVLTAPFFDTGGAPFSEDVHLDLLCKNKDVYTTTKRLGYVEGVARIGEGQDIRFMIPGAIYGPSICVEKATGSHNFNDRLIKAIKGEMPTQLPLPMPWVTAGDCAYVCVAALEMGVAGKRYIANGTPESGGTVAEIVNRACEIAGVSHRVAQYTKDELDSPDLLEKFGPTMPLLAKKAPARSVSDTRQTQESLGWVPTPLDEGLAQTINWFREVGVL